MQLADGFGNYIYIIFAVLYIIYSIIKAGKKVSKNRPTVEKQPQQTQTVQPPTAIPLPRKEDDFKKMLEDLMGGVPEIEIPEKQIIKPKPQPVTVKPQPAKIAPHHPKKEKLTTSQSKFISAKPKTTSASIPFVSHPEIVQKTFAETVEEESSIDFDIRQAIIYSEILKRPQY